MVLLLIIIFLLATIFQLYFWLYRLDKVNEYVSPHMVIVPEPSVSMIIAIKNEGKYLVEHVEKWLDQDYTNYEIIIIDDHSTDNSLEILKSFSNSKLRHLKMPLEKTGKKEALTLGIAEAKGEWILVTDGDCYPESNSWISTMMSCSSDKDVILGYSPYLTFPGFLNKLIRYETWYVAMQYISAALSNNAYMGVGRNMAFKKQIFEKVGGYQQHIGLRGGDDDLLIASLGKEVRYAVATARPSWVWTYPETSFSNYLNQKRRHLSTAPSYRLKTRIHLMSIYISQILWYITICWLIVLNPLWVLAVALRYGIIFFVFNRSRDTLGNKESSLWIPTFDFVLCFLYLILSFSYLKPKKDW